MVVLNNRFVCLFVFFYTSLNNKICWASPAATAASSSSFSPVFHFRCGKTFGNEDELILAQNRLHTYKHIYNTQAYKHINNYFTPFKHSLFSSARSGIMRLICLLTSSVTLYCHLLPYCSAPFKKSSFHSLRAVVVVLMLTLPHRCRLFTHQFRMKWKSIHIWFLCCCYLLHRRPK